MKSVFFPVTAALLLSGCVTSIGDTGPAGAVGPQGPMGPTNAAPQRLAVQRVTTSITMADNIDVIIADSADPITVALPSAAVTGSGRTITVRALGRGKVQVRASAGDMIDRATVFALDPDDMVTVVSDGDRRWTIIASSDL